jgi:hypothetical protein
MTNPFNSRLVRNYTVKSVLATFLNQWKELDEWISWLSCSCDQNTRENNKSEEGITLAHYSRGFSLWTPGPMPLSRTSWRQECVEEGASSPHSGQKRNTWRMWCHIQYPRICPWWPTSSKQDTLPTFHLLSVMPFYYEFIKRLIPSLGQTPHDAMTSGKTITDTPQRCVSLIL